MQWIDTTLGVGYISVRSHVKTFGEFLDGVDLLISHRHWRPAMPVIQDLRECRWIPPDSFLEEWRAYVDGRRSTLNGCRWAVVHAHHQPIAVSLLKAASDAAAPMGVRLQPFADMIEAHLWVKSPVPPVVPSPQV